MKTVTPEEMLSTGDLIAVGVQGDDVRRRMHGARTTFVRVLELHLGAIPAARPAGLTAGEFRIVGRPESEAVAVAAVKAAAHLAHGAALTGFSLADLQGLAADPDALAGLCSRLHDAGLEAIAEAPIDLLNEPAASIRAARDGGLGVWRLTVHNMKDEARLSIVERARDLQAAVGGVKAFAPLPRVMSITTPTTGYDDVKQIALARVVVTNIDSIQVDWPLYGPKLAQVALTVGADDVDGIAAVDPGLLGARRSPVEEIKGNIRAAALEAVERDGRFRLLA